MITTEDSGLLIIDVQGKLAEQMHDCSNLFKNLEILIQGSKLLNVPIVWIEQLPEKLGKTHPDIAKHLSQKPLAKSSFSALGDTNIRAEINGLNRKNWIVAGIECHVCVYQSVRDLLEMKYDVHLVSDAVSSRTLDNKKLGLQAMERAGANLTGTEMVLFELQKKAEGDVFKEMIKLIK